MEAGLLWFDDDAKRSLETKVRRAVDRYYEEYGVRPNTCFVNPSALLVKEARFDGVRVVAARNILLHHFLVGLLTPDRGNGNSGSGSGTSKRYPTRRTVRR